MKSFYDNVPVDVNEAAMAPRDRRFKGDAAATADLCFIFSWTGFLLSLFPTNSIRTLPVKIATFVTPTGSE